ncbi:MAG: type II toxin-antitoxin system RelE/ParE family toxin [Desulfomonilaceae bacterium]
MIKTFKDKRLEKFFEQEPSKIPNNLVRSLANKLEILDSASTLNDLSCLPGNNLEALKGSRQGQYSIRVNKQWRLCFEWRNDNVYSVELVDYHK